jgi:adenylate kinase family enzyme
MAQRIHITGASGCGVTTLGAALAERLNLAHLDTDDFYWLPTEPRFVDKRPVEDRLVMLEAALDAAPDGWVLSGSMDPWGDTLISRVDLVLFLRVPTEVRMARLAARERARHGAAIEPGGAQHDVSQHFLAWSAGYDAGDRPGRSLARHTAWLDRLPCPVLRLDGSRPIVWLVDEIVAACESEGGRPTRG